MEKQFRVRFNDNSEINHNVFDLQISSPDSFENPNLRRLSTRRGTMAVLANRRASCQYYPFSFCVIIILVDVVVVVVVVVMFDLLQIH